MRLSRRPTFILAFVTSLVIVLGLEPLSVAKETDTESPIGSVGGAVHADPFTGSATTSIPIEVPRGRNGVQPNLALTYAGNNGNGWVGIGWKLELGSIERQTRRGVDYTKNEFSIQLNGVTSELITAPAPAPSDEYRAKLEGAFLRIKQITGGGFEVTDQKGTKYLFGTTAVARMANPVDATKIFKWYLDRVEDRDGNFLTLTYVMDQGQAYLNHIDYTGNGANAPTNTVKFYLEDRTDGPTLFLGNYPVKLAKRLKIVEVRSNGNSIRSYKLIYTQDASNSSSELTTIQQFGMDAVVDGSGTITNESTASKLSRTDIDWGIVEKKFGTGSNYTGQWLGPGSSGFCSGATEATRYGDFNGDGKTDFLCEVRSTGTYWVALSDGTKFGTGSAYTGQWLGPGFCSGTTEATRYGDFNGDGKTDFLCEVRNTGTYWVALSDGTKFGTGSAYTGQWLGPGFCSGTTEVTQYADFNGDGKTDFLCEVRNTGTYWVALSDETKFGTGGNYSGQWLGSSVCTNGGQQYTQFGDFNGDGKIDFLCEVRNAGTYWVALSADQNTLLPGQMTAIYSGIGGQVSISYIPSTRYSNTQLPYPIQTVASITTCDNWNSPTATCAGISSATSYTYGGGYHHIAEREFRGFNYAKITGPVGPNEEQLITETWFHQGNDVAVDVNNPNVTNGYTKGMPYRTKISDAAGKVYNETTTTYVADADGVAPFFTPVAQVDTSIENGAKVTRTVMAQYDAYGNVLREDQYGDLATTADDRTVVRTFANNTTDWLIGFPTSETSYAGIGTTTQVGQTTLYYDGTTSCATASVNQIPTKGHVTRTVRWLNGGTSPETRMAYDVYGNVVCTRDANGNTTTVTYDATNTFAKTATNPLGHMVTTQYYGVDGVLMDKGFYGQVKSVIDPNNQTATTEYDALGRKTKTTSPDGLITTVTYNYGTGFTVGTQHVLTSTTGAGLAAALTSVSYFDGLGRGFKKETTGPDGKTVVTEVRYDSRGAVRQKSLPYFKTLESATGRWATTSYDALGRVTRMDSPDGTRGLSCYSDWVAVTIDAADHRKREVKDAYGRMARADEYAGTFGTCSTEVGTPYATTTYQYDTTGNLLAVIDAKGNVSTMTYDTLNRKTAMHDPDMGNWSYVYDAMGNLTKQTDAKAQVLWFRYDALNRRVQKDYTTQKALGSGDVRYTYDGATNNRKGRLQQVVDASGTVLFQYDSLGRISQTDKTLDGTTYTTQSTYDGLGRLLTVIYPGTPSTTISYAYSGPALDKVYQGATTYIQYTNYNALGQAGTTTYGNGVTTTQTYANTSNTVCSQQNFRLCTLVTAGPGSGGVSSGILNASFATPGTTVNLSTEGTADWTHWGLTTPSSFDRKSGVTAQISNFTAVGGGVAGQYSDNVSGYTWTGGTPTASATNSPTGLYIVGVNKGFQFTVPADTTQRTVKVYVSAWGAQGKMEAFLSDNSAAGYTETSLSDPGGSSAGAIRVFTFTYKAASAGQSLTIRWTNLVQNDPSGGNVTLQAATLVVNGSGGGGGGGGGTTTTYDSQLDFGSVQGVHGWYYLSSTGTQLTWNGSYWTGTDGFIGLWDSGGYPGNSTDAVRRWIAPQAGSLHLTGAAQDWDPASCGGDGAVVLLKKNGTTLWQRTIAIGDSVGQSFDLTNTVAVGDQIDLVINRNSTTACDNTDFYATLVLTTGSGGGTAYQDLRYVYSANGNVSDIYDNVMAGGAGDQHLNYDTLDRLTLASGPYGTNGANASLMYTYDELGNLTFNTQVGVYTYPISGTNSVRPHAVTTAGSNTYSYDANGNLTSGAGRALTYNLENKPLTITIAGQTTTFVYDGDGGRVKKIAGTTTTRYISKLYECDNTSCSRMVFAGGQRVATIGASGAIYYYHTDHLGSSSVITDSVGAKVQAVTYFPYGATRTNSSLVTPVVDVAYKYTGKELDSSTNLYYYEARYYDPTLGRFLSADTLVPNPRNPQDLNRYTYAGNNPFRYTDPTGHFKINVGKFLRRALGDVGTAIGGVLGQTLGNALYWSGNPLLGALVQNLGTAMLTQSKSGRYVLAGEIIVATVVLYSVCPGCDGGVAADFIGPLTAAQASAASAASATTSVLGGAAAGAVGGAALGGYSAAQNGGDISRGVLFGAAIGAISGAIGGAVAPAPYTFSTNLQGWWAQTVAKGLVTNFGSGAISSYAGGKGNIGGILLGATTNAGLGTVTTPASDLFFGQVVPGLIPATDMERYHINDLEGEGVWGPEPYAPFNTVLGKRLIGLMGDSGASTFAEVYGEKLGDFIHGRSIHLP